MRRLVLLFVLLLCSAFVEKPNGVAIAEQSRDVDARRRWKFGRTGCACDGLGRQLRYNADALILNAFRLPAFDDSGGSIGPSLHCRIFPLSFGLQGCGLLPLHALPIASVIAPFGRFGGGCRRLVARFAINVIK